MSAYSTSAAFQATDGISSVVQGIASTVAGMADEVITSWFGVAEAEEAASDAAVGLATLGIGALIGAAVVGVTQMDAMNKSMAGVAARTNASADDMQNLRKQSEALFNSGLVDNFDDAARSVESVYEHITGLDMTGDAMQQFIQDSAAVGKAWGISGSDVIDTVGKMQKMFTDLKGDPMQALNLLTSMAQETGKPLKEIESTVERWGPKFTAAGLSAQGMSGLITDAVQAGIGDKGLRALTTAVDTFHQKVLSPPSGFNAALTQLGLSGLANDIKTNKVSMDTALPEIFTQLGNIQDPAVRSALAQMLFGKGMADIASHQDTLKTLGGMNDALGDVNGTADTVAKTMSDDGTLGTALSKAGNNFKTWLGDKAQETYDRIKGIDWGGISQDINVIGDWLTNTWTNIWANAYLTVSNAWSNITNAVNGAVAGVSAAFKAIAGAIAGAIAPVINVMNELIGAMNSVLHTNIPTISWGDGSSGGGGSGGVSAGNVPARAHGGLLDPGWNLVGEKGPELIWSGSGGGMVYTNSQTQAMFSGSGAGSYGNGGGDNSQPIDITLTLDGAVLARMQYVHNQREDQRRGKRQ